MMQQTPVIKVTYDNVEIDHGKSIALLEMTKLESDVLFPVDISGLSVASSPNKQGHRR